MLQTACGAKVRRSRDTGSWLRWCVDSMMSFPVFTSKERRFWQRWITSHSLPTKIATEQSHCVRLCLGPHPIHVSENASVDALILQISKAMDKDEPHSRGHGSPPQVDPVHMLWTEHDVLQGLCSAPQVLDQAAVDALVIWLVPGLQPGQASARHRCCRNYALTEHLSFTPSFKPCHLRISWQCIDSRRLRLIHSLHENLHSVSCR